MAVKKKVKQVEPDGVSEDTKAIITVLLLVLLYPVGVIVMWFWTRWPLWLKILLGLPIVLLITGMLAAMLLIAINPRKSFEAAKMRSQNVTVTPITSPSVLYQ
jgi:phage-related holin